MTAPLDHQTLEQNFVKPNILKQERTKAGRRLKLIQEELRKRFLKLKEESGSHSPSTSTILESIPELTIDVDACFLSNPLATDLFLEFLREELLETGKLRDVLEFYPAQNVEISKHLSPYLDVPKDMVFIGNGAVEIIQAFLHNFTEKSILINIPTFSSYYEFVRPDTRTIFHQLDKSKDFRLDQKDFVDVVKKEKPDTVVLINPNNPDGGYLTIDKLSSLISELKSVKNIVVDESFIHFAYEDDSLDLHSLAPLTKKFENLTIIKSMSKDFGIAGIRAGYAVMHPTKVTKLLKNGYLWNSSGLAEYFFKLYAREDFLKRYEKVRRKYIRDTQFFFAELLEIPNIKIYPSKANFALIEILNGRTATDLVMDLLFNHGIYVRTCSDKIGLEKGEFIRLASRSEKENRKTASALKQCLL